MSNHALTRRSNGALRSGLLGARILRALAEAAGPLTSGALAEIVYADDHAGGPGETSIRVTILGLRRRGFELPSRYAVGYRLTDADRAKLREPAHG